MEKMIHKSRKQCTLYNWKPYFSISNSEVGLIFNLSEHAFHLEVYPVEHNIDDKYSTKRYKDNY